jgi:hypothetical protein
MCSSVVPCTFHGQILGDDVLADLGEAELAPCSGFGFGFGYGFGFGFAFGFGFGFELAPPRR